MKLIFLDIDGTLTSFGADVPPSSALEAIAKTRSLGNKVFLCTGRNYFLVEPFLPYGFDGVIGSAGAYIILDDKVVRDEPLDRELVKRTLDILHRNGIPAMLETRDANYGDENISAFLRGTKGNENSEMARWRRALFERNFMKPMSLYEGEPVYKLVGMITEDEQLEEPMRLLQDDYEFALMKAKDGKRVRNIELLNKTYTKGAGVRFCAERYGTALADTYGFGDSMNDLSMIETVGTGVCMANGDEELKKYSTFIAESVDEDGIYKAFAALGLLDDKKEDCHGTELPEMRP